MCKTDLNNATETYKTELDKIRELENTNDVYLTAAVECRNWAWKPVVRILYTLDDCPTEYIVEIIKETGKIESV